MKKLEAVESSALRLSRKNGCAAEVSWHREEDTVKLVANAQTGKIEWSRYPKIYRGVLSEILTREKAAFYLEEGK